MLGLRQRSHPSQKAQKDRPVIDRSVQALVKCLMSVSTSQGGTIEVVLVLGLVLKDMREAVVLGCGLRMHPLH